MILRCQSRHPNWNHTQFGLTFYSKIEDAPIHKMLKMNDIVPSRKMFTFCDSSWDDDYDTSRSTGGYLVFYQGGVVDDSSNMPIPVAMSMQKLSIMKLVLPAWPLETCI